MANQIDDYVKRPVRYQNIDGLGELGFGILWMALPLLEFFNKTAASGSIWHHRATFFVCIGAVTFVILYGQKVLKKHITHPRTGYVKYRPNRTRMAIAVLVAIAVAIAIVLVVPRLAPHSSETVKMALLSVGWGLLYAFGSRMEEAWRWVVLVALIVAPPVVTTLPIGQLWSGNLPFALQGLIFAVSGAVALALYLRRNPVPEQAAE
jgi:hypothetical protein